jgi:hypothetical protein
MPEGSRNFRQDIGEPSLRVDVVELRGLNQRVDGGGSRPLRLCDDDGGNEHEDRSDENDGQCVPHSGP